MFKRPEIFQQFTNLVVAESTRHGGFSEKPYTSLNLGLYSGDSKETVLKNRRQFYQALGIGERRVAHSYQTHSDEIVVVTRGKAYQGYDALITARKGVFISVTVADCTPILIFDPVQQAVGAVHAGWRGTVKQIVAKTIQKMQSEFKTNPADCFAYVGTCIDECSFEVGLEVADEFMPEFKRFDAEKQKFFIDLKKANFVQLLNCGLPENQIEISEFSTILHNEDYFSFRKERGKTGRFAALIGMKLEE
ncbi:peptidoglycan editing factor PgeF [Flectobacillus major]|uniref:peptidoglycan editing factor PgeF n=1 Tax=Flectobacillus major TaxID=103 RepID=UPI00040A81C2|nr:peptidoglycan editing factor PgeF [Flectobacillus major]